MLFRNRADAAQKVAEEVAAMLDFRDFDTVVGLARGGVPIARAVAEAGGLPLTVMLVDDYGGENKKVFVSPFGNAMNRVYNGPVKTDKLVDSANDAENQAIDRAFPKFLESVIRRQNLYNGCLPEMGPRIILCDDGIVSGRTVRFAAHTLRKFCGVTNIVLATPVLPQGLSSVSIGVDDIVYTFESSLKAPPTGLFYREFEDIPDSQVVALREEYAAALVG